jgi:hypothetical protein
VTGVRVEGTLVDAAHKLRALLTAHLGGGLSGKTGAE